MFNGSESASHLRPKIWEQIPLEIKILTPLLVLKKKLENGNMRIASVEFAKFTYQIYVLFKVYSEIPFGEDSYHFRDQSTDLQIRSNRFTGLYVVQDFTNGVSERSIGLRKYLYFYL